MAQCRAEIARRLAEGQELIFASRNAEEDRMRKLLQVVSLTMSATLTNGALAFDNGRYEDMPADIRAWFRNVLAPNGLPCCDISDGHRTDYDMRNGAYWVPIDGAWIEVPERAVIHGARNPVGQGVVWYVHQQDSIVISCFVPADAV
jgi:hypothetical protein